MSDVAIRVENLGKRYRIGSQKEQYGMLRDIVMGAAKAPLRRLRRGDRPPAEEFWALRDVSFELKQGEILGVIGRNGAGKSTLLKILSRITEPTAGRATIHGRVGSLLEVGTGFHPELTGRENIYLNGAIIGMSRQDIDRRFDEIVEFAGVERFLDTPVKRYSSGMYTRLAFSVAAHLEPEVLIVDEVLSVGDAAFQQKSLGKMGDVAREGRTVLFVSHNLSAVVRLCTRAVWLQSGSIRSEGDSDVVVSRYLNADAATRGERLWRRNPTSSDELWIDSVSIRNNEGEITEQFESCEPIFVSVSYQTISTISYYRVGIIIQTTQGITVLETYDIDDLRNTHESISPGRYTYRCIVPANLLAPGRYVLSINAGIPNYRSFIHHDRVLAFNVDDTGAVGSHMAVPREGIIRPQLQWERWEVGVDHEIH